MLKACFPRVCARHPCDLQLPWRGRRGPGEICSTRHQPQDTAVIPHAMTIDMQDNQNRVDNCVDDGLQGSDRRLPMLARIIAMTTVLVKMVDDGHAANDDNVANFHV